MTVVSSFTRSFVVARLHAVRHLADAFEATSRNICQLLVDGAGDDVSAIRRFAGGMLLRRAWRRGYDDSRRAPEPSLTSSRLRH